MNFGIAILVAFVVCLSSSVYGAERDVIRIFDENLRLTDIKMEEYLKQANLEGYGFVRTNETSTVTDKYGRKTTKMTIYYKITDDCSNLPRWERILERRLPKKLTKSGIFSKTVKEVQKRIDGRITKSCTVALEIHPGQCRDKNGGNTRVSKRAAKRCGWWSKCCGCRLCSSASIVFN